MLPRAAIGSIERGPGMMGEATAERGVVVGVDVGGTKTALLATDVASGEDLATDTFATPAEAGPEASITELCGAIERIVEAAGRRREELRAVGVAVPGHVNFDAGRVIEAGNLAGWSDVPLRDILARVLGVPVWVDQDGKAAALGERWRGGAKEMHNFVFLSLGTGLGAGVMINGRLRRGFHNASGEVGNFVMGRKLLGRTEDKHGNLEMLVGGPTIRRRAKEATGEEMSAAEALRRAAEDERLRPLAEEVADYVAMAVVSIVALLDPEAIVFGGGTSEAGEALIDPVRERVERELTMRPALMRSVLGTDAQLHGAVFGALWELDPDLALREELR
ncbi:MAG: ROK family protein [Chloroflexota bacterium]|nr:ROK family protein [Chloroflexota bacterium]